MEATILGLKFTDYTLKPAVLGLGCGSSCF